MRPGLSRAVPMGILGFLVAMIILVLLRGLQGLQPLMEPELAIILGTFFAAGFFVYGLGAFDPMMNQHAHEPAEGEELYPVVAAESADEAAPPGKILGAYVWQLSTILLVILLVIVAFALLPEGPSLRTVHEAGGDVAAVGAVPIPIGAETIYVSQLTFLVGFVIFMFLSLAAVAGGMGLVFFALNNGSVQVKNIQKTAIETEPVSAAPAAGRDVVRWLVVSVIVAVGFAVVDTLIGRPITAEFATLSFFLAAAGLFTLTLILLGAIIRGVAGRKNWAWLVRAIIILGLVHGLMAAAFLISWFLLSGLSVVAALVFNIVVLAVLVLGRMTVGVAYTILNGILIPLFYFVLIGLVVPFAPPLLFIISASNTLLIAALILRPKFITRWVGYGAAWTAKQLRRLPNAVQ